MIFELTQMHVLYINNIIHFKVFSICRRGPPYEYMNYVFCSERRKQRPIISFYPVYDSDINKKKPGRFVLN